jgi:hypothetical protein
MHDNIGAELERALQVRCCERVVHDDDRPTVLRERDDCLIALLFFASATIALRSTSLSRGFVGDSIHTIAVSSPIAAAAAAVSLRST